MSDEHFEGLKKDELHVTGGDNGCLWRGCGRSGHNHRKNGKAYLESHKGKLGRYYNHDFSSTTNKARKRIDDIMGDKKYGGVRSTDPRYHKKLWHIGEKNNFATGKHPWVNNAHHILPCASLKNAFAGIGEFEILLKGQYNINAGENIIYLPKKKKDGQIMQMVTHPGSHPTYNTAIETLIKSKIKPKIKKARDKRLKGHGPLNEKDIPKLKKMINIETENIMLNTLKYGKIGAGITVNQFDPHWTKK